MFGFILRRLIAAVVVLILTSFLTFTLFYKGPTNPAAALCQERGRCTAEKQEALETSMGFNDGLMTNYGRFVGGLFKDRTISQGATYTCDAPCLGISFRTKTEVSKDLLTYYPATLSLAIGGGLLYLLIGVPLGVLAARFRGTVFDKVLVGGALVIGSIPYYVFALTAWIFLTLQTSIFPTTQYVPITEDPTQWFLGLLLPWLILGITGAPTYARYARGQMLEAMGEDYIRSGKAKGLTQRKLLFKHSLRVAIVPIVTIFGLDFAALLSGTIFTESIFGINGIGQWTLTSLRAPTDFPILTATILIFAVFVILGNLVVDLLYAVLDPRVRLT
ncbi:ABC transporter permease [Nocardioides rubriscoriae]|uniref:ABC transporter permease n=1 Tax=Nocardioides rubriscoriae TaxID=642762 RepID=UPI0011DFAEC7|nr:ABC transporter permease [Nocardioides rubriscoriae]